MRIYMAAVYTNSYMPGMPRYFELTEYEKTIPASLPNILESYHYVKKQSFVDAMRNNGAKVFIDSGAFSAWTLGANIDLGTYCEYIKENSDIIKVEDGVMLASVLDGIGDPLQTYRNQLEMEARGVKPLPCFHFGEDERYLEYYIKNYQYITLGGLVNSSVKTICVWLDRIWDKYLVDGSGKAKLKVHAFGITSPYVMERYPWHSVDSTNWLMTASFGSLMTPDWGVVRISDKSPSRHDMGSHLFNFTDIEKQKVIETLERQGFTQERLSTVYQSRAAYNMWSFCEIERNLNSRKDFKFVPENSELF